MKANNLKTASYWKYIFQKEQLLDYLVIFAVTFIGCLFVTYSAPYPGTMTDSFGYLWAAIDNQFIPFRPFGYSEYLRLIHLFSDNIFSVIVSQALLYAISLTLLALAVKKYWNIPNRTVFYVVEIAVALNFTAIYMLDTIMADTLFCSMIFLMLAMLLIVIKEKSWIALCVYLIAFFISLHTRYSAMFFPVAFLPILLLSGNMRMRIVSVVLTIAIFLVFRAQIKESMYESVHIRQFSSGFDGWQLSNNAFHVLPYVDAEDGMPKDKNLKLMHRFCVDDYDNYILQKTNNGKNVTSSFLWNSESPLKQILYSDIQMHNTNYQESWVRLGSGLYADYGKWLILKYPGKFFRHYLLPNIKGVFYPSNLEIIGSYSPVPAGKSEIIDWFDYPINKGLEVRNKAFYRIFGPILPWIDLVTWIVFVAALVFLFVKRTWLDMDRETKLSLLLILLFGFILYSTTTFASPVVIRYWMPMHSIKLIFAWIVYCQSYRFQFVC